MDGVNQISIKKYSLIALIFALCAAVVVPAIYFAVFHGPILEKQEAWGQFGDFLGGVLNPIFSFSSLMALLLTLYLQGKQTEVAVSTLIASEKESNAAKKELVNTSRLLTEIAADIRRSSNAANVSAELSALTATLSVLDGAGAREERIGGILAMNRREEIHVQRERIAQRVIELAQALSADGRNTSQ